MMIPGMGVNIASGTVGALLVTASLLLFFAGYIPWLRRRLEDIFVPGKHLFAQKASYSGTVTFLKWSGWLFGGLLLLPTFVLIDLCFAAVAFMLWRYLVHRVQVAIAGKQA
jgi:hypothetical protein